MVLAEILAPIAQGNEFDGNHILSLVQHLKECVLAVGAGLTPYNGGGRHRKWHAILGHALAIAFHLQLLKICGQAAQAMAVRGDAAAGELAEITVPDIQKTQVDWKIFL